MKESEAARLDKMWEIERQKAALGFSAIAGIDEAGRGPLAGDVFAAAVILPPDFIIEGLNDSKKVSEKKREALFDMICENARAWCVATASIEEIDNLNIRNAAFLAMRRAFDSLATRGDFALIDGNAVNFFDDTPHECVIKGDAKCVSVAAASILAKVSRDRYMMTLDEKYPEYGFAKHKGYGTKEHIEAIKKHGACEFHRKTFIKKFI